MGIMWSLARSSSKIFATFVVLILMSLILIFAIPDAYLSLQDMANAIDQSVRNPPMEDDTRKVIYRFLVNGTTILSVIMTLIARAIVEVGMWAFSGIRNGLRKEGELDAAESAAGIRDEGYYE